MVNPLNKYYNNSELTKVEKILVMFQITDKQKIWDLAKGDVDLENMAKIIDDLNEDEEIVGAYYKEEMDEWMKNVDINNAKKEGLTEGFEQGTKRAHVDVAKKLLKMGLNIKDISQATSLSKKEINLLKD